MTRGRPGFVTGARYDEGTSGARSLGPWRGAFSVLGSLFRCAFVVLRIAHNLHRPETRSRPRPTRTTMRKNERQAAVSMQITMVHPRVIGFASLDGVIPRSSPSTRRTPSNLCAATTGTPRSSPPSVRPPRAQERLGTADHRRGRRAPAEHGPRHRRVGQPPWSSASARCRTSSSGTSP